MTRSLVDLLRDAARRHGPRTALAIRRGLRTRRWSYAELPPLVEQAAEQLRAAGLQPRDRALILSPNCPELVIAMFALWEAGAVLVPVDLNTPPEVIQRVRASTEARLLVGLQPASGGPELADLPTLSLFEIAEAHPLAPLPPVSPTALPETELPTGLAEIVFTSGATGSPKGVTLTHASILANVEASLETMPIAAGTRILSILPLSHMLEQTVGLFVALAAGTTVFYATSRRPAALIAAMQRHRIQLIVCVPELLRRLAAGIEREVERSGRRRQWELALALAERLPHTQRAALFREAHARLGGCLRIVQCGGAPLEPAVWRTWELLGVRVIEGYGATECSPVVASTRLDRRLPGCVGWPLRGVEVRLAPDGEVLVRGPNLFSGYWRDPAATGAVLRDGWLHSGDMAEFGPQGELRLLGRKREMIVLPDGRNVFPQDVEDAVKQDPAVTDCAVVGRPRPSGGVEVHAVVIPAGDPEAAVAAARAANRRLGPQQQIHGVTVWEQGDFPRTPSFKVKRTAVLEALAQTSGPIVAPVASGTEPDSLQNRVRLLIARVVEREPGEIGLESDLALDLGLDSLGRVELATLLEEELGQTLSDEEMAPLQSVGELVSALERGSAAEAPIALPDWPRARLAIAARGLLQRLLLFPALHTMAQPLRVRHPERLEGLNGPLLILANHTSHLDSLTVLSLLPATLRRRATVAGAADYFFAGEPLASLAALTLGAFPFHREGSISSSLTHCGDLVDDGYSIVIFPEGTRSPSGELQSFKSGIGLLARELEIPVLPIYLQGLHAMLPKGRSWPCPGAVTATIGEPSRVPRELSNQEAAEQLEAALRALSQEADPALPRP